MAGYIGNNEKPEGTASLACPPACPVCLKPLYQLRAVCNCGHAADFCRQCLQDHFEKNDTVNGFFTCPICKMGFPYPEGGVDGLPSVKYAVEAVVVSDQAKESEPKATKVSDVKLQVNVGCLQRPLCDICHHVRGSSARSPAATLCEQCDVNLCDTCRADHKRRPATKDHVLKPFADTTHDDMGICREHARNMKQYCKMCNVPLCGVCVSTSHHKDHVVCSITEALSTSVAAIEKLVSGGEKQVREWEDREMTAKSARRAKIEWRDAVIKQVETTAEACIKMVQEQKEKILKEIKNECEPMKEDNLLKNVVKVRAEISEMVKEGIELISLAAKSSADVTLLNKLFDIEKRLGEALSERDSRVPVITLACRQPSVFHAESNPVTIGSLKRDEFIRAEYQMDMVLPGFLDGYTLVRARCLHGKGYAAIYNFEGAPYDELLVFGLDGKCQITVNIPRTCGTGMDVDEKNQVVILTAGANKDMGTYYIEVFDTKSGKCLHVTKTFTLPKPLSMAVSPEGRYLILSEGELDTRIFSVVDTEGNLNPEQTSVMANADIKGHSRITCGWDKIYTMAPDGCFEYKMVNGKITYSQTIPKSKCSEMEDLSVDPFCGGGVYFISSVGVMRSRWNNQSKKYVFTTIEGCERLCKYTRLHIHNHSLLVARNDKIHVYTLQG